MKDEGSCANNERIDFSFESLCALNSATESQIIIIDLTLSFISIHRGLLVHHLFQNYNFVNFLLFNTQQCATMFFEHRIGWSTRSTLLFYEVCGAVAALVFFEMPLVVDTEWNRSKYERYISISKHLKFSNYLKLR